MIFLPPGCEGRGFPGVPEQRAELWRGVEPLQPRRAVRDHHGAHSDHEAGAAATRANAGARHGLLRVASAPEPPRGALLQVGMGSLLCGNEFHG